MKTQPRREALLQRFLHKLKQKTFFNEIEFKGA